MSLGKEPANNATYIKPQDGSINIALQFIYPFLYIALRYKTPEAVQRSPFDDSLINTLRDAALDISRVPTRYPIDSHPLISSTNSMGHLLSRRDTMRPTHRKMISSH